MKRLNLIFASEGEPVEVVEVAEPVFTPGEQVTINDGDVTPEMITPELEAQLSALDTTLMMYPEMAKDPEVAKLIAIKAGMDRAFNKAQQAAPVEQKVEQTEPKPADTKAPVVVAATDNPFDGGEATATDFTGVTEKTLAATVSKSFGIDTTKPTWTADLLTKFSKFAEEAQAVQPIKEELEALKADIGALPKEVQMIVQAVFEKKDWKSAIGNGSSIDYSKNFSELSPAEKVAVHNFYFPDDVLEATADVTSKDVAKAVKVAELSYSADKKLSESKAQADKAKADSETAAWNASVTHTIDEFKKQYPTFRKSDLAKAENIFKGAGIASIFIDKNGNAVPDAFEKLVFAIHGKALLKTTAAVASNKGKSEGKAEVLQTVRTDGGGTKDNAKQLTDEEKQNLQVLEESQSSYTY